MVVQIRGKTYHTVADRLTQAHGDQGKPTGIQCITTEPVAVGDTVLVKATIPFADGRQFCGMAEVITTSSGAQATNPVECAETSAVGLGTGDGRVLWQRRWDRGCRGSTSRDQAAEWTRGQPPPTSNDATEEPIRWVAAK